MFVSLSKMAVTRPSSKFQDENVVIALVNDSASKSDSSKTELIKNAWANGDAIEITYRRVTVEELTDLDRKA
jgi:hypothetical protein